MKELSIALVAGGSDPKNAGGPVIMIQTWCRKSLRFINFADHLRKPGRFLEYNVKKYDTQNGNRDHHVDEANHYESNQRFGFDVHIFNF